MQFDIIGSGGGSYSKLGTIQLSLGDFLLQKLISYEEP